METTKQNNSAAMEIGCKLKELRKEQRMGKPEVATRAGMKVPTLTAIEEGRYNTGIRQITDIAHALGAKVDIVPRLARDGLKHGIVEYL